MSTLAITHPTLLDVTKRLDPGGKIDTIAEIIAQTNEVMDDMVWLEGNLPTGHRTTIRTGLPTPTWRKLYGGVQPTKSRTAQITDNCGMLEDYAEVDKALADLNGNTAAFRLSEDRAHIEGISQTLASALFYSNEATAPEQITGLSPRFNSTSAANGDHVLLGGGTENCSMWLVVWGPNTVHGIYPKGSQAGLQMNDKGQVTIESIDGNGGRMEAYRTHYRWDCGLCVRDWRYVVRLQLDYSALTKNAATGADLIDRMSTMLRRIPSLSMGRPAFYAPRDVLDFIDRQSMNKSTLALKSIEDAHGKMVTMFRNIPIRQCDSLLYTETELS